jgi:cell shape-determining protein MreC
MMNEVPEIQSDQWPGEVAFAPSRALRSVDRPERTGPRRRLTGPAAALLAGLVLAVGLMLVPASWTAAAKGQVLGWLRPGQLAVLTVREHIGRCLARASAHFDSAARLVEAELRCQRLAAENRRLAAELALAADRQPGSAPSVGEASSQRLLNAHCVEARVLGQSAQAFLGRRQLIDVGSKAGVQPDAPVLYAPPRIVDPGRDAGLQPGQLLLSQGRVCGKVVQVGHYTSLVQTLTEPGYRDLVQLGCGGPQGILEGTGDPLARIRLVEVTEPVTVGDQVYSTAGEGSLPEHLLYGRVVRVERPVGAAHWEIWMQPALDPGRTDQFAVLRIELNPARVGSRELGVTSR